MLVSEASPLWIQSLRSASLREVFHQDLSFHQRSLQLPRAGDSSFSSCVAWISISTIFLSCLCRATSWLAMSPEVLPLTVWRNPFAVQVQLQRLHLPDLCKRNSSGGQLSVQLSQLGSQAWGDCHYCSNAPGQGRWTMFEETVRQPLSMPSRFCFSYFAD
jgi:hypothetical protein